MTADRKIALYPIDGGTPSPMPGTETGEIPIQWASDNTALFVYEPTGLPARVMRVTLATGERTLWKELSPSDPAGVYRIAPVLLTPDGTQYAYNGIRALSDLYVAEGVK